MNGPFWSNTIWYLLLLASSIIAIAITFKKSRDRKFTAAFNLAALGVTYWIEVLLLIVLNAYTYYPMLTPWDAFQDAVLGNFFSQISVSTTAVLYCVLGLRGIYLFVFAVVYYLIDVLFVHLGIYEHYWYRSIYTFFGFIPYCYVIKKWYLWLTDAPHNTPKLFSLRALRNLPLQKWLETATLYFAVFAAAGNSVITSQKLLNLQIFRSGIFEDMSKDHTATSLIYGPVLIVLLILLHRWKISRFYKGGALFVLLCCQWILYAYGILTVQPGWFIAATVIDLLGFYFWVVYLERLLASRRNPSHMA